ncbi:MAG: calcium-binding protein [Planctomycetota bacterium]
MNQTYSASVSIKSVADTCVLVALLLGSWFSATIVVAQDPVPVDASKLAFYPDRWKAADVDFNLLGWEGEDVVFLTQKGDYDKEQLAAFVDVLDQGWRTQLELVGKPPVAFRQFNGKPTICALPKSNLSCGYGCGYVGATGIEVAGFYNKDWPAFRADPEAFAHYYFYEMGRNFFVYGQKHSLFTTGYAVFIRYVCMDRVGCKDSDQKTRDTIERCEAIYAASDVRFMDAFTDLGAGEKRNRLRDASGKTLAPSDQPVMYATAMLKLRKDHGGDEWVKRFLHRMHDCKAYRATDEASAMGQCFNWLVCASSAAGEDLTRVFADRWRMPISPEQREIMKQVDWGSSELAVAKVVDQLLAAGEED